MATTTIGIVLAKLVFSTCIVDARGHALARKDLRRDARHFSTECWHPDTPFSSRIVSYDTLRRERITSPRGVFSETYAKKLPRPVSWRSLPSLLDVRAIRRAATAPALEGH